MVRKLRPEFNKVYFINQYTLVHILSGQGTVEVDFKNYPDWQDKAIYLSKGQYIKFLSDNFEVRMIEFPDEIMFRSKDIRVLFKHLISLGYINFTECADCQKYLDQAILSEGNAGLIDVSSEQWYWQNPFDASRAEYQLIFDIKDVIDEHYHQHLTNKELAAVINDGGNDAMALLRNKIGMSVRQLMSHKRLVESKREIAFSDHSIQQISYSMGYKDPSYFNKVFQRSTGSSPVQFRQEFEYEKRDTFVADIMELIRKHHAQERSLEFYANKMNLSIKALSKKTRMKINTSLGQLIRSEVMQSAKKMLAQDTPIVDIAYRLGFEEPQHFSHFFKKYASFSPSDYKIQKYHS